MLLPRLHPLSLPLFRRLHLRLRLQLQLPHHKLRALGLRRVMGVLGVVVEAEAEAENQGVDVVGSVDGEAGEGVGITEGEVGEDVESNINICLYNLQIVSSENYLGRIQICASLSDLIPFQTAAYAHAYAPEEPSEDGDTPQRAVVFLSSYPHPGPILP